MLTSPRLKILISAYACRPGEGSEPAISWNLAQTLVKFHEIWLITRENNRPGITTALTEKPCPGLNIIYCDLPPWLQELNRGQRLVQIHYYLWQILAYFKVRQLHPSVQWDLIHHLTYVKYWSPSFLALLPIPFIWGPVGGGETAPKAFWSTLSRRGKLYEILRDIARWAGELDPFVKLTARRSTIAFATTEETAQRLRVLGAPEVKVLSQLGLSQAEIEQLQGDKGVTDKTRQIFLSIGRLLHWKGFHLGLQAFAKANLDAGTQYWIVGDGPERARLEKLAKELGIGDRVQFPGKLPRPEILQTLQQGYALIHPSLHESGGMVCLEAMASGCPVICLNLGGPALQITPLTGYKITADSPESAIADLANTLTQLSQNPNQQKALSIAAQQRVYNHYTWTTKAQFFAQVYTQTTKEFREYSMILPK